MSSNTVQEKIAQPDLDDTTWSCRFRQLPSRARRHPVIAAVLLLLALAAMIFTARLSVFMFKPDRTEFSLDPDTPFLVHHSCLSSYVAGAALFERGDPNLYEPSHYRAETADHGIDIGFFEQDPYQYPPFLLVPFRASLYLTHDFLTLRTFWFVVEGLLILLSMVLVARWIGGERGFLALLLLPLVWASPPNLIALQFGNVQGLVLVAAILGMIAFEKDRTQLGGALLAFAILAKIFPVVLVVYLAARRQWRALAATALWGVVLSATVVLFGGLGPWLSFLGFQLPRLSNGEAFADLISTTPSTALLNLAYSSFPYKLDALGFWTAQPVSHLAATLGNLMALVAAGIIGWHDLVDNRSPSGKVSGDQRRLGKAAGWLALVNLSTLQATMSPLYALIGTIWLLTLWAANRARSKATSTAWMLTVAVLSLMIAAPRTDLIAVIGALVVQLMNISVNLAVVFARSRALARPRAA